MFTPWCYALRQDSKQWSHPWIKTSETRSQNRPFSHVFMYVYQCVCVCMVSKYHSNEQGPRGSCQPPNISSAACDWMWFSGCKALTSKALGYCLSRDKSASALLPGISKKVPATSHPDQSIIWSCPGDMGYCFRDGNFFSVSPEGSIRQSPQSLWHLRLSQRGLMSPCHPCPGGKCVHQRYWSLQAHKPQILMCFLSTQSSPLFFMASPPHDGSRHFPREVHSSDNLSIFSPHASFSSRSPLLLPHLRLSPFPTSSCLQLWR